MVRQCNPKVIESAKNSIAQYAPLWNALANMPTQEEIDAEAWKIGQEVITKYQKTFDELAKR